MLTIVIFNGMFGSEASNNFPYLIFSSMITTVHPPKVIFTSLSRNNLCIFLIWLEFYTTL